MNARRRIFLALAVSTLVVPRWVEGQARPQRKIGFLGGGNAQTDAPGIAIARDPIATGLAKSLQRPSGTAIPPSLLLRADMVIQ